MRKFVPIAALAVLLISGCQPQSQGTPAPVPSQSTPTPTESLDPNTVGPVQPSGPGTVLATGLISPWSVVRLESGSALISERDTGLIKELTPDGAIRDVGEVPGVVASGEGGLLGLEVVESGPWLYAYFTSSSDNRIVRFDLVGEPGGYALGAATDILTGLARAGNHNGGRIKVGPDEKLYATVGDASNPSSSQDLASLNGKILRIELDGSIPADNPFAGSAVYSLGHRNPQGIAWDRSGQLWASEFGQNTWDEFNVIHPGGNYGWPNVEGTGNDPAYLNPVGQWSTAEASPSGLVWTRDSFFMAALRGQRVWAIYTENGSVSTSSWFAGEFGRIRDVIAGPEGTLWVLTNNTDGRGDPREGDDKLIQFDLTPLQ